MVYLRAENPQIQKGGFLMDDRSMDGKEKSRESFQSIKKKVSC